MTVVVLDADVKKIGDRNEWVDPYIDVAVRD